jgi:hypothetical protein
MRSGGNTVFGHFPWNPLFSRGKQLLAACGSFDKVANAPALATLTPGFPEGIRTDNALTLGYAPYF